MPAVAVEDGCCVMASLEALAALTVMPLEMAGLNAPEVKVSVIPLAALVTNSPLKLATPLLGVAVLAVLVAFRLPPLVSLAVITVVYELTVLP